MNLLTRVVLLCCLIFTVLCQNFTMDRKIIQANFALDGVHDPDTNTIYYLTKGALYKVNITKQKVEQSPLIDEFIHAPFLDKKNEQILFFTRANDRVSTLHYLDTKSLNITKSIEVPQIGEFSPEEALFHPETRTAILYGFLFYPKKGVVDPTRVINIDDLSVKDLSPFKIYGRVDSNGAACIYDKQRNKGYFLSQIVDKNTTNPQLSLTEINYNAPGDVTIIDRIINLPIADSVELALDVEKNIIYGAMLYYKSNSTSPNLMQINLNNGDVKAVRHEYDAWGLFVDEQTHSVYFSCGEEPGETAKLITTDEKFEKFEDAGMTSGNLHFGRGILVRDQDQDPTVFFITFPMGVNILNR
ncbi:F-box/LRR repeat-containing protein [Acrasis kona]|uniref:F-box/LRR repeat-containing protein n=1 Tax=Acrasis kona TaxID=1008807 RepID=A0AAW2ZLS0_9EUKA